MEQRKTPLRKRTILMTSNAISAKATEKTLKNVVKYSITRMLFIELLRSTKMN